MDLALDVYVKRDLVAVLVRVVVKDAVPVEVRQVTCSAKDAPRTIPIGDISWTRAYKQQVYVISFSLGFTNFRSFESDCCVLRAPCGANTATTTRDADGISSLRVPPFAEAKHYAIAGLDPGQSPSPEQRPLADIPSLDLSRGRGRSQIRRLV